MRRKLNKTLIQSIGMENTLYVHEIFCFVLLLVYDLIFYFIENLRSERVQDENRSNAPGQSSQMSVDAECK